MENKCIICGRETKNKNNICYDCNLKEGLSNDVTAKSGIHRFYETEYSKQFDKLRENRVSVSFYKYGSAKNNFGDNLTSAIANISLCLSKYSQTHNTEYLVDAANYCMFEFMYPKYEDAYFKATGSEDSAGIVGFCVKEIEDFDKNVY